jgi:hypothetical protein
MKILRAIPAFVLSLLLVFNIVFLQGFLFLNNKLLNTNFYLTKFESLGFYNYLYDSIYKNFGQVSRESNLPLELFNNILTKDWVKEQTENSTKEIIDYMTYKTNTISVLDTKVQADKFNENFDNYIKSLNLKLDQNTQKEMANIKVKVSDIIKNQANFINMTSLNKNSTFQNLRKVVYTAYSSKLVIFAVILINLLLLLLVVRRKLSNFTTWIGYTLIVGGFFTLIPSLLGGFSGFVNNIAISDSVLKALAISFIKEGLFFFSITGGVIMVLGIGVTFFSALYEAKH